MKSTLFKLLIGTALGLAPVQAMYDAQEEDKGTLPQTKAFQQNTSRKETSTSTSFKGNISFEAFPDDLFKYICSFFGVSDLGRTAQISTQWKTRIENPGLWRYMGSRYYGDYLSEEDLKENSKQMVVYHYLSVLVNMTGNLKEIERLINYYHLDLYPLPFKKYIDLSFLLNLIKGHASDYEKGLIVGKKIGFLDQQAIQRKIEGLAGGYYSHDNRFIEYSKQPDIIEEQDKYSQGYNLLPPDYRVWKQRCYENVYKKNLIAARDFIDSLTVDGNLMAIQRKIQGLLDGNCGYQKNPSAAREFIESLLINETPIARAIGKYFKAFAMKYGVAKLGYTKDPAKAIEFIKHNHVPY